MLAHWPSVAGSSVATSGVAVTGVSGRRALVVSPGRAQVAGWLTQQPTCETAAAWYLDLHDAAQASLCVPESIEVLCGADLPEAEVDLVAVPVLKRGEAELTRDLLQQAHRRLATGGHLVASVDNAKDSWLHEQLQALFDKVSCSRQAKGCVYWARKTSAPRKLKEFACEFAFRDDEDRLIQAVSRPGVFAHRRADAGARQLMLAAEIGSQDNVLDMGCGAGTLSLASAFKTSGLVFGVDSNARAIECLKRGAQLNSLDNIRPVWNAEGDLQLPVPIDVALANPPYFGEDTISQHFVDTALATLRPGGALLVVTKKPKWYAAYFQHVLEDIAIFESSRYFVACGRKPLNSASAE